jgi:hypothetical protein
MSDFREEPQKQWVIAGSIPSRIENLKKFLYSCNDPGVLPVSLITQVLEPTLMTNAGCHTILAVVTLAACM